VSDDWALPALWLLWGSFWILAPAGSRPRERREPRRSRVVHIALVACAFSLLFFGPLRIGILGWSVLPPEPAIHLSGMGFAAIGLGFATWARLHLGRQWSGTVAISSEQRFVRTGPYQLVRHPLYTGLLLAIIGTAKSIGELGAALAVPIAVFAYRRKLHIEEAWLLQKFGHPYEIYRGRVGGLQPFTQLGTVLRESFARSQRDLLTSASLIATVDRLRTSGHLSTARSERLQQQLPEAMSRSWYVLKHLGVHLGMGTLFFFDIIPLPLGTISRVLWVAGNRVYESALGSPERARIHSLKVLLVAFVPWVGYGAYLLPLRRESPEVAWLYAQHLSYSLNGMAFEEFLATKPRVVQRVGRYLIPPLPEEPALRPPDRPPST
jgi:protein-S-isoprenylcysteine O-methyltransferase Ste14